MFDGATSWIIFAERNGYQMSLSQFRIFQFSRDYVEISVATSKSGLINECKSCANVFLQHNEGQKSTTQQRMAVEWTKRKQITHFAFQVSQQNNIYVIPRKKG